ncbi:ubiquinol oxidase subunit II [Sphingomonas panacisoli]|uniref:Ubiquinol oxidase subunit 2 n=1 Tax=Sphingomonas panacisoli TaxID=1813879 RepID=A0A5B8LJQ5_9SPHN|nr:ubiquinol oxidase subunit II [Sphingomonas panacisoli]
MIRLLSAVVLLGALSGCEPAILDSAGPVAASDRHIMLDAFAIMLAIVVPVIAATLAFAWWFRAGNSRAKYRPDWAYSGQLELLVWSVPTLAVIFLGGIAWIGSHAADPATPIGSDPPLRVEVVSLDWKWLFIYPDQGVASVNHLVVPAGRAVSLRLTSATVMNSFFVPQLGSQIYTMAGMTTRLNWRADRTGRYRGLSANYSGSGFPGMALAVDAVTPDQFARWIQGAKAGAQILDGAAYAGLLRPSRNVAPYTYRAVAPGLFDAIVRDAGTRTAQTAVDGRGN